MKEFLHTKCPSMPPFDAREKIILNWTYWRLPAMGTLSVLTRRMKNFAMNPQLSSNIHWLQLPPSISF